MAQLADGGWIVTYNTNYGSGLDVYHRRYDANGNAMSSEMVVHASTTGTQSTSNVMALDNGGWVIVWQNQQTNDNFGIYQQRFSTGAKVGGEILVTSCTYQSGDQKNAEIAPMNGGGWLIVWGGDGAGGAHNIYQQRYDASGNKVALDGSPIVTTFMEPEIQTFAFDPDCAADALRRPRRRRHWLAARRELT